MKHQPVYDLFRERVAKNPDGIAIEWQSERVTYQTVADKAANIANHLISAGAAKGEIAAVLAENTVEIVPALIGILEAGLAFVILDPNLPQSRMEKMMGVAEPKWYLLEGHCGPLAQSLGIPKDQSLVLAGDRLEGARNLQDEVFQKTPPETDHDPDGICYLYFTSGSTGTPKAIAGRLKSLDHFIQWEIEAFEVDDQARVSQLTAPTFDAYLRDIFTPLCAGGTICVPDSPHTVIDAPALVSWLEEHRVTMVHTVPSLFRILLGEPLTAQSLPDLKHMILAGEPLLPSDVRRWTDFFEERIRLHNFYGPSETTMIKFHHTVVTSDKNERFVPIGQPIPGCKGMVLDPRGNPCAPGSVGEIIIRTPFRSLGYYRDPALTNRVFVQNPFNPNPADLIYKTGDFGRKLPDGSFQCLGRMDQQVKIRGVRIELEEIETLLNEHPDIAESAVAATQLKGDNAEEGEKHLVAYVVPAGGEKLNDHVLHEFLAEELPETVVPSIFMYLDILPRLINGKIDRKSLPKPEALHPERKTTYIAPRNEDEETMASIWSKILKLEQVGVQDNFFEIGGHSLLATLVLSRVRRAFKITLPLGILFEAKTIEKLCGFIASKREDTPVAEVAAIEAVPRDQTLPLSYGQQGLWFIYKLFPDNPLFRIPVAVRLKGDLDQGVLAAALNEITARHENLRTRFVQDGQQPIQIIDPHREQQLQAEPLPGEGDLDGRIEATINQDAAVNFTLEEGPLLFVKLYEMEPQSYLLTITFHHIIMDEWSMGVFVTELNELYDAYKNNRSPALPSLPIQYGDFAHWQQKNLTADKLQGQLDWWKRRLAGAPEFSSLPSDKERPETMTTVGRRERFVFTEDLSNQIKAFSKAEDATTFMTLFSTVSWLMRWYTNKNDMVLGAMVAGRQQPEVEHLIGLFVNQLAMRFQPEDDTAFGAYLRDVRKGIGDAFNHQDVPFNTLVEAVKPTRNPAHAPLFQVLFAFQPTAVETGRIGDVEAELLHGEWTSAQLDMILHITDAGTRLTGHIEYNTDLYDQATITDFISHLQFLLAMVVSSKEIQLKAAVEQLTEESRRKRLAQREAQMAAERGGLSKKRRRRGIKGT